MQRIAVIGCGGAGKTALAIELGRRLDLPVIHLDALYWRPGWVETPQAEWEARQPELYAGERWIADGNFHGTLHFRTARADAVIFLDFPRRTCLRGVLGRVLRQHGQVRVDMAPGCPERFDLEFLHWVWTFRRVVRPHVLRSLAAFAASGGLVITLRGRREVHDFIRHIDPVRRSGSATT